MKNQKEKLRNQSIPFTSATKRIKYLGINLPKETKELYTENNKTLMKEIKDDIKMERYSKFLGRKNIVQLTILLKAITDSMLSLSNCQ